jgi:hypothetical protein
MGRRKFSSDFWLHTNPELLGWVHDAGASFRVDLYPQ